jgi:hypothetical protein
MLDYIFKTGQSFCLNTILEEVKGTTFANLVTVTDVAIQSAKNNPNCEGVAIKKICQLTVIIANNLKETTNLYHNKVARTIEGIEPENFVFSGSNYTREQGDAYSVVSLKSDTTKKYLEAFPQKTQSVNYVMIKGGAMVAIEKADLEKYLTKGEWAKLNVDKSVVYNATNDCTHSAIIRNYKLESIKEITTGGATYQGEFVA